jgi:hypothetical protein
MKKLLLFRIAVITFIVFNFVLSFKLETEADCLIMLFTFLFSIGYLGAETINAFDKAKHNS